MTDRANITISSNMKSYIGYQFECLNFILVHSKGQGHAHFDCKYVRNGVRYGKHY